MGMALSYVQSLSTFVKILLLEWLNCFIFAFFLDLDFRLSCSFLGVNNRGKSLNFWNAARFKWTLMACWFGKSWFFFFLFNFRIKVGIVIRCENLFVRAANSERFSGTFFFFFFGIFFSLRRRAFSISKFLHTSVVYLRLRTNDNIWVFSYYFSLGVSVILVILRWVIRTHIRVRGTHST